MKSKIWNEINKSNSILLMTHEKPDGDAVGSVLGFYHYLISINKNVDMVILEKPKIFDFLPSIDRVVDSSSCCSYDLGIVFDCASKERIGQDDDLFSRCKNTICIDHHVSNTNYCNLNLIDGKISSCCQVIYYLLKDWNVDINKEICESLICGVLTDTNGFSTNSVDSNTYKLALEMMDLGINIHKIYDKVLSKKTLAQYNLSKIAMDRLEFIFDGKIAFTYILKDDFVKTGASFGEHEGIVDIGKNIEGVFVSVFIREDDGFTFSLRSTGYVDVSKIALQFNGGGHFMAAGGKINSSFKETKDKIINEIIKELSL